MKIHKIFTFLTMLCICQSGMSGQEKQNFRSVSADEFAKFIQGPDVVLLDVRTEEEFNDGHIPGTDFNIDVLEKSFKKKSLEVLPQGKSVALYCRSGNRSKNAARILSSYGYQVVELGTGFRGWTASGGPIETSAQK